MTAWTNATATAVYQIPGSEIKELIVVLPSTCAASDTVVLTGIGTIYDVKLMLASGGACAASTAWSSLTVTIPSTEATGVKYLHVWGIK